MSFLAKLNKRLIPVVVLAGLAVFFVGYLIISKVTEYSKKLWSYLSLHFNKDLIPVIALAAIAVIITGSMFLTKTTAYILYIDDNPSLTVKNPQAVDNAITNIISQKEDQSANKLEYINTINYQQVFVSKKTIVAADELENALLASLVFEVPAAAIMVDGKPISYLEDYVQAQAVLKRLNQTYQVVDEGEKLLSLKYAEKVEITDTMTVPNSVSDEETSYQLITTGTDHPEKYTVQEGDSLWLIARRNDMYVDDIVIANQLQNDKLSLGQELVLVKSKPLINVIAQVEGERIEEIPYETIVEIDTNSSSSVRVKQTGQNGSKNVVYAATKINGIIDSRDIKEETIIEAAVDQIMVKGSRVVVASRGGMTASGSLPWPAYGPITSYFSSGGHTGLDIAGKYGSTITSVLPGVVTFTGYQGGYGNFIIIDHGNGMVTRYAHCSRIDVSTGDYVDAQQAIGAIGSTGRSTGPHVHFEVLQGGVFQNPLNYLR